MRLEFDGVKLVADSAWVQIMCDVQPTGKGEEVSERLLLRLPSKLFTRISSTSFHNKVSRLSDRERLELISNEITRQLAVLVLEERENVDDVSA